MSIAAPLPTITKPTVVCHGMQALNNQLVCVVVSKHAFGTCGGR